MMFGNADDGMCTSDVYGRLIRVFRPRWWELRRWVGWFLSRERVVTEIAWIVPIQPSESRRANVWQNKGKQIVRAFLLDTKQRPPRTVPMELH